MAQAKVRGHSERQTPSARAHRRRLRRVARVQSSWVTMPCSVAVGPARYTVYLWVGRSVTDGNLSTAVTVPETLKSNSYGVPVSADAVRLRYHHAVFIANPATRLLKLTYPSTAETLADVLTKRTPATPLPRS